MQNTSLYTNVPNPPRPIFLQVLRPARLILHPDDPGLSASPPLGRGSARARAISCHNPIQVTQPLGLCRSLKRRRQRWMALSRCGQPSTTRQLGSPRRERSLGVGVRLPVAGRRRITRPRAPAVVEHLVSALRIVVSVSSPRPPARLPSCPVPSHAPSPPAHIRSLLSSTRRPLPLAFGRRRGLNTVGFGVAIKVRPRA